MKNFKEFIKEQPNDDQIKTESTNLHGHKRTKRQQERMYWGGEMKKYKDLDPMVAYELLHTLSKYYYSKLNTIKVSYDYDTVKKEFNKYSEKLSKELAKKYNLDPNIVPKLTRYDFEDIAT